MSTDGTMVVGGSTTATNYDIENYGNGWYRLWMETTTSATSNFYQILPNVTNTSVGECYFYGAQAEEGSYPTSYIPTYGTSGERTGDNCFLNSTSILEQTSATYFLETTPEEITSNNFIDARGASSTNNRILWQTNSVRS